MSTKAATTTDAASRACSMEAVQLPNVRRHMPPLDGLRGIAILAVLAYHYSLFNGIAATSAAATAWRAVTDAGWIGVDLFFVLSGFLITGILCDSRNNAGYFRTFYTRRSLRIFPLYYAAVIAFFLILPLLFAHLDVVRSNTGGQAWYWTHLSNVLVAQRGWDAASPYVAHLWSLAVEEQFYLVWPLVVLLLSSRGLLRFCAGIIVFSFALRCYLFTTGANVAGFVLTPARMDTFAFGAIVALAVRDAGLYARVRRLATPAALVSTAVLGALVVLRGVPDKFDPVMGTVGFSALAALSAAAIFFAAAGAGSTRYNMVLAARGLRFFGKYSYALYIFHQPIALLLNGAGLSTALARVGVSGIAAHIVFAIVATAASVTASLISWHLLEKQFLKLKDRVAVRASHAPDPAALQWSQDRELVLQSNL